MSDVWWPQNGPHVHGNEIPPVAYLDWYEPRLLEQRPHDLSHSGLQLDWSEELSNIPNLIIHPLYDGIDVRQLIAQREGVAIERVVATHGATDAIHLAIAAALPSGSKRLAVEMPSYAPVSQSARMMGIETVEFNRINSGTGPWILDRDRLSEIIPTVDGVLITPILNPTGFDLLTEDMDWLVEACRMEGIPLIADEVYNDSLRVSGNSRPAHTLGEHCVSINSLTKIYALGSLRFGWIIASEEVANNAMRALMTFTGMLATPSARLAAAAWPHLQKALDAIEERRKHAIPLLEKLLEKHGIDWQAPPQGVFGAFDIGVDAMQAIDGIGKQEGLLAIPGCMFHKDLKTWMRVAWSKSPEDFAEDIQALDRVLTRIQS